MGNTVELPIVSRLNDVLLPMEIKRNKQVRLIFDETVVVTMCSGINVS